jgi:hypothetical protein
MKKLTVLLSLLPFLVLFPSGCKKSGEKEEVKDMKAHSQMDTAGEKRIVALVNNVPVYEDDLGEVPAQGLIENEILYQVGLKRGLDKNFENEINAYKKRLIVSAVETEIINQLPSQITQSAIEEYYNENEDRFTDFQIKKIETKDKDMAEEIQKRLKSDEDIENIAKEYSLKTQSSNVRGLPFIETYKDQFRAYDVGSVSEIVNQGNEFQISIIVAKNIVPLPKVYNTIKYMLQEQTGKRAIQEFAENVKKEKKLNGDIADIVYQEGVARGLDKKLQDDVEAYKRRLILKELNKEISNGLTRKVTDKEVEDYYNENKNKYTYLYIKKITTSDKKEADEMYQRASGGEDLQKIASDFGKTTADSTVRDLGIGNRYQGYLQAMNEGKTVGILETKNGYEIFKIVNTKQIPISRARPVIYFNLLNDKKSEAINKLKEENQIVVKVSENKKES